MLAKGRGPHKREPLLTFDVTWAQTLAGALERRRREPGSIDHGTGAPSAAVLGYWPRRMFPRMLDRPPPPPPVPVGSLGMSQERNAWVLRVWM